MPETRARTSTAIRFEPELHRRLKATADELGVPVNWLVNRLVAEGLDAMLPIHEIRRLTRRPETDDG